MDRLLVPRLVDEINTNAQNLNAKAMLKRWSLEGFAVDCIYYHPPAPEIAEHRSIRPHRLWRWRFWRLHMALTYARSYDGIFYPGCDISDIWGLRVNKWFRPKLPIVATMEGLAGNPGREAEYSAWAGRPVFCQHVDDRTLARVDYALEVADHVIAISPFLARMGAKRYGDKFSVIPLGVDTKTFCPAPPGRESRERRVISVGSLQESKRPDLFLKLAQQHPEVKFVWFGGGGVRRDCLISKARDLQLTNLEFPGSLQPTELAREFRKADIFVLPANSEGVPKVTQEAAASGLPIVIFGFYETPTVVHERNGFVVWNDRELFDRVGQLIASPDLCAEMGAEGTRMAKDWDWDKVAPLWEEKVSDLIGAGRSTGH